MQLSTHLPLYEEIRRELQGRMESGELRVGDRIVPEIELAKQLGVSRSTARKALQCLTDEGYISRTAGRGSFVLERKRGDRMPGGRVLELAVCSVNIAGAGSELARGFLCEALGAGCATVAWPWQAHGEPLPHGASGCAIWAGAETASALAYVEAARRANTPVVLIDAQSSNAAWDEVSFDHAGMARALALELLEKGHKIIGVIAGPDSPTLTARLAGFREALAQADLSDWSDLVIQGDPANPDALERALLGLLGRRDRPTALLCIDEGLAPWVAKAVARLGYVPGQDIALALVDDSQPAVPCVSARLDVAAAGREAAKLLLRRLEAPAAPPQRAKAGFVLSAG
jgi:GntR family transcriptional regulator of arabinose operon